MGLLPPVQEEEGGGGGFERGGGGGGRSLSLREPLLTRGQGPIKMSDIFGPASLKGGQGRIGANGSSPYSSLPGSQRQKSVGNGKGSAEWSGGMHGGIRGSVSEGSDASSSKSEDPGASLTWREKVSMAVAIAGGYITWGTLFSVQPPFYPTEAQRKGATPSEYGFVFGIAHLAALLASPIFATYASRVGAKTVFISGSLLQSLCGGILFALLDDVDDKTLFLCLSYLLRALFGLGNAGAFCSALGMVISYFPSRATGFLAILETFFGLGYLIGPGIGSVLYSAGGFKLPFLVVGSFSLAFAFVGCCIPNPQSAVDKQAEKKQRKRQMSGAEEDREEQKVLRLADIIKSPSILYPYTILALINAGYGFIEAMLEPHAKAAAGMTQGQVGIAFFTMGGSYMVTASVLGQIADRLTKPYQYVVMGASGSALMCCTQVLIGPADVLPLSPSAGMIFGGMAVAGVSYGCVIVSSFARTHSAAVALGYPENIDTFVMLSGTFSFAFYVGNFLGPTIAGFIVESEGFRFAATVFFFLYLATLTAEAVDLSSKLIGARRESYQKF